MEWRWSNFSEDEIFNPVFDDCTANSFDEMEEQQAIRLQANLDILQLARTDRETDLGRDAAKMRQNSTYREHDSIGKAHRSYGAIDHQLVNHDWDYGHWLFEWAVLNEDRIFDVIRRYYPGCKGFRILWEYNDSSKRNGNSGWWHSDIDYKVGDERFQLLTVYEKPNGQMQFDFYRGQSPKELYEQERE